MQRLPSIPFATDEYVKFSLMDSPADRLRKAIKRRGYDDMAAFAKAVGVKDTTLRGQVNRDSIPKGAAERYAQKLKIPVAWLLYRQGPDPFSDNVSRVFDGAANLGADLTLRPKANVVGYVGAGAEIFPLDDYARGNGMETVDAPIGFGADLVAVRVRGNSMFPMLLDGWLIFYRKDIEGVDDSYVNKLCVVRVAGGPTLVKWLRKGSKKGGYDLESFNAPTRKDETLEWASPVLDIRPR